MGATCFLDVARLVVVNYMYVLLGTNEKRVDVVSPQELVPVSTMSSLCLVSAFKAVQSSLGDVNAPVEGKKITSELPCFR